MNSRNIGKIVYKDYKESAIEHFFKTIKIIFLMDKQSFFFGFL